MFKSLISLAVVAGTFVSGAGSDNAFFETEENAWQQTVITINLDRVEKYGIDFDAVVSEWNLPITFVRVSENADIDVWATHFSVPAAGMVNKEISDNVITSCVIEISAGLTTSPDDFDFNTAVFSHEFGHCMGIEHNDENESIMATNVFSDKWSQNVTDADSQAAARIYR